jgi:type IV secretion system protein VirD4
MKNKIKWNLTGVPTPQVSQRSHRMSARVAPFGDPLGGGGPVPTEHADEEVTDSPGAQPVLPPALGGRPVRMPGVAVVAAPMWDQIPLWPWSVVLGAGAMVAAAGVAGKVTASVRGHRHPRVSREVRVQWRRHPGPGFAGRWTLWRRYGRHGARKVARHGRQSLSWADLYFGPVTEYATYHGRAQGWWPHRWGVFSTFEQIVLVIAPPQEGKSSKAAASIIDDPGPVVVTSIRGDLIAQTAGLRQQVGHLYVWNPEGVGRYASTLKWNPVAGCQDMQAAIRRSDYLVRASDTKGLADADFWADQASMLLSSLMHAAALISANMRTVHQWIVERSDDPVHILAEHLGADPTARMMVTEWLQMTDKTRDGVVTTLNRCLRFMMHPGVVEMLSPPAGEGFDFDSFVQSRDTLYLVSGDAVGNPTSPLFTAFLAELAESSKQLGAKQQVNGEWVSRLDPPLTFELDEVANIAPIPVDTWASWASGSGIRIHLYLQSWSQALARWGQHGADGLWAACKCKIIVSAISEAELMKKISTMAGKVRVREEDEVHNDRWGHERRRRRFTLIDVIAESSVRATPPGYALVISSSAKPTVIKVENVRARKDYKRWEASGEPIRIGTVQRRQIPVPRPELADQHRPSVPVPDVPVLPDEIAARRARRQPEQAPPLPLPGRAPVQAPPNGATTHTPPPSFGGDSSPVLPEASPNADPQTEPVEQREEQVWNPWQHTGGGEA